jgi:bacteriorhodopsin
LAGTNLGVAVVDGCVFFYLRYVDLAVTFPLLLLMVGLFSATPLVEILFLASMTALMFLSQLLAGLHPEHNRWLFFALNLLLALPALSAITSGFRAQAQQRHHDVYVAARVGHVCLLLLLYLIIVQLFLLLSSCLHYIDAMQEATALTIADVVVKVGISLAILFSPELVAKAVDGDGVLHALCAAEMEGEGGEGEAGLETSSSVLRSLRKKGGDPAHMRPEPTERSCLRGKA